MNWREFKGLSKEEQQDYIDKTWESSPVNGAILGRHFGVSTPTAVRLLKNRELTIHPHVSKPIEIDAGILKAIHRVVAERTSANGNLLPSIELKHLFVQSGVGEYNNDTMQYVFRLTRDAEEEAGVDLCQFDSTRLDMVFNGCFGVSVINNHYALAILRRYVEFCRMAGINVSNAIQNYTPNLTNKIQNQMVASPHHLAVRLDKALDPISTQSVDCLYRGLMWLAYAGIAQVDAAMVTESNICLKKLYVVTGDRKYPLYQEGAPLFNTLLGCSKLSMTNAFGSYWRDRVDGDLLLRGVINKSINIKSMLHSMSTKTRRKNVYLSYNMIKKSGQFYRIYETERAGYKLDFASMVAERIASGYTKPDVYQIKNDYEAWKRAFG